MDEHRRLHLLDEDQDVIDDVLAELGRQQRGKAEHLRRLVNLRIQEEAARAQDH